MAYKNILLPLSGSLFDFGTGMAFHGIPGVVLGCEIFAKVGLKILKANFKQNIYNLIMGSLGLLYFRPYLQKDILNAVKMRLRFSLLRIQAASKFPYFQYFRQLDFIRRINAVVR